MNSYRYQGWEQIHTANPYRQQDSRNGVGKEMRLQTYRTWPNPSGRTDGTPHLTLYNYITSSPIACENVLLRKHSKFCRHSHKAVVSSLWSLISLKRKKIPLASLVLIFFLLSIQNTYSADSSHLTPGCRDNKTGDLYIIRALNIQFTCTDPNRIAVFCEQDGVTPSNGTGGLWHRSNEMTF